MLNLNRKTQQPVLDVDNPAPASGSSEVVASLELKEKAQLLPKNIKSNNSGQHSSTTSTDEETEKSEPSKSAKKKVNLYILCTSVPKNGTKKSPSRYNPKYELIS